MTWREKPNHIFFSGYAVCVTAPCEVQTEEMCVCVCPVASQSVFISRIAPVAFSISSYFSSVDVLPHFPFFIFTNLTPSHSFCFFVVYFFRPHLFFSPPQSYLRRSTPVTRQPSPGRCHASHWMTTRIRSCKPIRKGESTSALCPATSPLPT